MTRVTQLIHDAEKYLLISVYPLPTHPTHNFTHKNGGNLETLPGWPKKLQHNRPARRAQVNNSEVTAEELHATHLIVIEVILCKTRQKPIHSCRGYIQWQHYALFQKRHDQLPLSYTSWWKVLMHVTPYHTCDHYTNNDKYTYSCKSMKRESPGGL